MLSCSEKFNDPEDLLRLSGLSIHELAKFNEIFMATNCYRCSCVRSLWMTTVRFIVSQEEGIRRKRRLVWGIIVLLMVDVLWVGSSELTDVRNFYLKMHIHT